jgi:EF-P beta-lysylation protein EpmB
LGRWQTLLGEAITDPQELLRELELPLRLLPAARQASAGFRLQVPRGFVRRMRRGDPDDPLLRQVLPLGEELEVGDGYSLDPLREQQSMAAPGVLHKYHGRVLLTLTGACAVHCRYCFRRHYPYSDATAGRANAQLAIDYLQRHPEVEELILSGGDPLSLSDNRLQSLVTRLASIRHLKRLRIHSRLPVVLPERVDQRLLDWISTPRFSVVLVIHCNHANEIDVPLREAMDKLRAAGVTLLNQSVLLRGVNDRLDTLLQLSERLFEAGVLPYYLHQLDPVQGASHFAVREQTGRQLVDAMRKRLPGYLVPRLVREDPGQPSKTPL